MKNITPIFVTKINNLYSMNSENVLMYNFDRTISDNLNRANALIVKNNDELDLLIDNTNPFMLSKVTLPVIRYLDNAICQINKWLDLMTSSSSIKNDLRILRSEIAHHIFLISNKEKLNR